MSCLDELTWTAVWLPWELVKAGAHASRWGLKNMKFKIQESQARIVN